MANSLTERVGTLTAMAGEFFVMTSLYRLGYQAALTLGNAKSIDIFMRNRSGRRLEVSVKAIRGGGKWGVGTEDLTNRPDLFFVLLLFAAFDDVREPPKVWVVPAAEIGRLRKPWLGKAKAVFAYNTQGVDFVKELDPFENAWNLLDGSVA